MSNNPASSRNVHMVLSARSLSYAAVAIKTLFYNSAQPLNVRFITDGDDDKAAIGNALAGIHCASHRWTLHSMQECDERAVAFYRGHDAILAFRRGHPCWRKITDPPLFATPGEEMVILDPDLYFPNSFAFEATPPGQLLLMWQRPHCLLPSESVLAAYKAGVKLAHHTDIGVAQVHNDLPLDWLNWFLGKLGGSSIPPVMHVESIVWAALAMRMGGGYLDPHHWICWHRTFLKRLLLQFKVPGHQLLRLEPLQRAKCFHAGGVAKMWLCEAERRGRLRGIAPQLEPGRFLPFEELTPLQYRNRELAKSIYHLPAHGLSWVKSQCVSSS